MQDGPLLGGEVTAKEPVAQDAPAHTVPLIGLTGGMGAGKSTALDAMSVLGADVLSTDKVVHELYCCDRVRAALVERWGEQVAPGGVVSRQAVAERVFSSEEERAWLEHMLWPLVGERVAVWLALARAKEPAPRAAVVETPLLFESGMDKACDATIALVADEAVRNERAAARGHARIKERAARQLTQLEKAERATFTIHNDGSIDELWHELSGLLDKLTG
jgi:dephospho-CoA kinase